MTLTLAREIIFLPKNGELPPTAAAKFLAAFKLTANYKYIFFYQHSIQRYDKAAET
jgi:hypothetical protein